MRAILPFCKCECGRRIKTRGKNFIRGYNSHRRFVSKETSEKRIRSLKKVVHTPEWNKKVSESHMGMGHPLTEETKRKLSIANKGKIISPETKRKLSEANIGKKYSLEVRKRMSEGQKKRKPHSEASKEKRRQSMLGKNRGPLSEDHKMKLSIAHTGIPLSEDQKRKISQSMKGKSTQLHTEEAKRKMSLAHIGKPSPFKGKKFSEEQKMRMRLAHIKRVERQNNNGEPLTPCVGIFETSCLNLLESNIRYMILRQFRVCGYFLDGFIEELNLAVEFDEYVHERPDRKERDKLRENNIQKELGCQFLRIKEDHWKNDPTSVLNSFKNILRAIELGIKIA